tara:strand:+ start:165 stop:506 length:342 start_codon:yes stop_codon:yes gene_type:complete
MSSDYEKNRAHAEKIKAVVGGAAQKLIIDESPRRKRVVGNLIKAAKKGKRSTQKFIKDQKPNRKSVMGNLTKTAKKYTKKVGAVLADDARNHIVYKKYKKFKARIDNAQRTQK